MDRTKRWRRRRRRKPTAAEPTAAAPPPGLPNRTRRGAMCMCLWNPGRSARLLLLFLCTPVPTSSAALIAPVLVQVGLLGENGLNSAQLLALANQRLHQLNLTDTDVYDISVKSYDMSATCPGGVKSDSGSSQAMDLFFNSNVSAFFGPICPDDLDLVGRVSTAADVLQFNFWRDDSVSAELDKTIQMSTMAPNNLVANIVAVLSIFAWKKIAVITCVHCFETYDRYSGMSASVRELLVGQQIELLASVQLDPVANGSLAVGSMVAQMASLKNEARVLLAIMGNTLGTYVPFLQALQVLGMDTEEFVPILCIDRYRPELVDLPWEVSGNTIDEGTLSLFEGSIVIANDFYQSSQVTDFASQLGISSSSTSSAGDSLLMLSVQLYESFWTYALALWHAFRASGDRQSYLNGTGLRASLRNGTIQGPFGPITINEHFDRIAPYRVFLVQSNGTARRGLLELANITMEVDCPNAEGNCKASLTAKLLDSNLNLQDKFPLDVPSCGFNGELCDQRGTIIVAVSVMVAVCLGFVIFLCFRKVKRGETTQMPYYVPEQLISFVDMDYGGSSNISIHSFQQHLDKQQKELDDQGKGTDAGEDVYLKKIATIEQSFVIVESYRLKEKLSFDKRDMQLLFQMKQAVHDNINPFIGVCVERPSELLVIWRHCFRGTLRDLLFANPAQGSRRHELGASVMSLSEMEEGVPLGEQQGAAAARPGQKDIIDHNFKSAFVRDIIKGLDFLHSSSIGYHGALTSTHCLIDSHWILKLSGFGFSRLLYKWRHNGVLASSASNGLIQPLIPNEELHYYAPEVRSAIRSAVLRNKPEELEFTNEDGQTQDMFSFGAILYEILYRRRIVDFENTSEGLGAIEAMEDDVGIFSAQAEDRLPIFPHFPEEESEHSLRGSVTNNAHSQHIDRVHPDLVSLMRKCFGRVDQRPDANMARKITDATLKMPGSLVDQMIKNMEQYTNNLENLVKEQTGKLEVEQQKAEQILLELLPKSVVDELRLGRRVEPQFYASVTIMYSDIVGFTSLCSESQPMEVVNLLNGMFRAFDFAISQHKAYKVETIGDAYMVASGVPEKLESHVREIASTALMQRDFLFDYEIPHRKGQHLHCRWGFNSGSVFTGVVGITAPRYCVFGTTVTLAAKMENSGQPDKVQMTLKSYQLLTEQFPEFKCTPRGGVRIEGVGTLLTYWLDGYDSGVISDRSGNTSQAAANELGPSPPTQ